MAKWILPIILTFLSTPALAHGLCIRGATHQQVVDMLVQEGQQIVGLGLEDNGSLVELLTGRDGSFSIIATHPDGVVCAVAGGSEWSAVPLPAPGRPS